MVRLTPGTDKVLVSDEKGRPLGRVPMTPELGELLGGKTRLFEGTFLGGLLTLGEEHAS